MRNLKLYRIDSEFDFGKFKGKVLRDIIFIESGYFRWCINKVDWFVVEDEILTQALAECKNLYFDNESCDFESSIDYHRRINDKKLRKLNEIEIENENCYFVNDDHYDERYYYSGNWLVDAAGTDDPEVMNDVYWNLD